MKKVYNNYINDKLKLKKWQIVGIICLITVITGVFGWLYEFIFYYFNSGMTKFYWRGGNFLPWINIYATGSFLIILLTRRIKKNPFLVFIISFFSTGILEYISGYAMFKLRNGLRCWDYNTEILNFGNINGFVCLRSVTFFGLSALLLVYCIIPFCIFLSTKITKKKFLILSVFLCSIFMIDELYNLMFARILNLPRASTIYKKIGFNYMDYYRKK